MKLKSGLYETDKYRCLGNLNNDSVDLRLIYCGYEDCAPGHRYGPNKRSAYLIHFYGRHYNEMHYERTPVRHETVSIGSRRGVSGHQHNTFAILAEQDTTEDYGACYGLSLMYSGIFLLEAEQDQYSQTRIQMGIADELLDYRLCPGECFYAPEVIMGYSQEGLAQLSHIFHHFLRENVCRGKYKKVRRPILVNNWEATYFSFTGKKLIDLGVYSFLEKLQTRYPDLLIEGCGSGGCRFDAGMMYYTPQIWTSDNTDAIERLSIQYGASFGYPVSVIGSHISAVPNHQNGRTTDIRTRGVVAMSGNFGYELDLTKLGSDEKEQIKKQIQVFKEDWQLLPVHRPENSRRIFCVEYGFTGSVGSAAQPCNHQHAWQQPADLCEMQGAARKPSLLLPRDTGNLQRCCTEDHRYTRLFTFRGISGIPVPSHTGRIKSAS